MGERGICDTSKNKDFKKIKIKNNVIFRRHSEAAPPANKLKSCVTGQRPPVALPAASPPETHPLTDGEEAFTIQSSGWDQKSRVPAKLYFPRHRARALGELAAMAQREPPSPLKGRQCD